MGAAERTVRASAAGARVDRVPGVMVATTLTSRESVKERGSARRHAGLERCLAQLPADQDRGVIPITTVLGITSTVLAARLAIGRP